MKLDTAWTTTLAEIAANLSAGWIAALVITPSLSQPFTRLDGILLLTDLIFGIVFLLVSVKLRRNL